LAGKSLIPSVLAYYRPACQTQ